MGGLLLGYKHQNRLNAHCYIRDSDPAVNQVSHRCRETWRRPARFPSAVDKTSPTITSAFMLFQNRREMVATIKKSAKPPKERTPAFASRTLCSSLRTSATGPLREKVYLPRLIKRPGSR